jgi:hypothetical protein
VTGISLGWAAACGSADSATTTSPVCLIYAGSSGEANEPDGANNCPPGECNYQTQAGCAAAETCFPHYDATSQTISATCGQAGTQQVGDVCGDTAQHVCAKGLVCVDSVCAKMCCDGDWGACGAREGCIRQASKFRVVPTGETVSYDPRLGTCAPVGTCDVLDPNACAGDTKRPICRIVDARGSVACSPVSDGGDRNIGEACDNDHQCGKGQHCAGNGAVEGGVNVPTYCVRFCRWGSCHGDPSCPESEGVCVHFDRDPDGVGECTPNWKGPGQEIDAGAPPAHPPAVTADAAVDH